MEKPKEKPKETAPKSKRGGARPGSGRKRKAITEIRDTLISKIAGSPPDDLGPKIKAAEYAFRLFDQTMRGNRFGIQTRLDCASKILDRVWGKPKQSVEMSGPAGGVIPVSVEAAIERIYGTPTPREESETPAV